MVKIKHDLLRGKRAGDKTISTDSNGNIILENKNNHTHSYVPTGNVKNDLTTGGASNVLSAEQGKTLNTNKLAKNADDTSTGYITAKGFKVTGAASGTFVKADGSTAAANNYSHPSGQQCTHNHDSSYIKKTADDSTSYYVTAKGFKVSGKSNFLKADGTTADANNYSHPSTKQCDAAAGTHTHAYVNDGNVGTYAGTGALATGLQSKEDYIGYWTNSSASNHKYGVISVRTNGQYNGFAIYSDTQLTANNLMWNAQTGTNKWQGERTILDSSNYSSYANLYSHPSGKQCDAAPGTHTSVTANSTTLGHVKAGTSVGAADTANGSAGTATSGLYAPADHVHKQSTIYATSGHNHDSTYVKKSIAPTTTKLTSLGNTNNTYNMDGYVNFLKINQQVIAHLRFSFKSHATAQTAVFICNVPSEYAPITGVYDNLSVFGSDYAVFNASDATTTGSRSQYIYLQHITDGAGTKVWQLLIGSAVTNTTMNCRTQLTWFTS